MKELHEILNEYYDSWNIAFKSKNGDGIRTYMSNAFVGYWGHSGLDRPMQYEYDYDLDGVLKQYEEAHKSFETLSLTERNNGEEYVVLGTETNVVNGVPHPAKCMLIWKKEKDQWKLQREFIEMEK